MATPTPSPSFPTVLTAGNTPDAGLLPVHPCPSHIRVFAQVAPAAWALFPYLDVWLHLSHSATPSLVLLTSPPCGVPPEPSTSSLCDPSHFLSRSWHPVPPAWSSLPTLAHSTSMPFPISLWFDSLQLSTNELAWQNIFVYDQHLLHLPKCSEMAAQLKQT